MTSRKRTHADAACRAWLAAILLGLAAPSALAHGDLHEQIDAATREIAKAPRNAERYTQRGELHRAHGDWDAALVDFETAGALDPRLPALDFLRGRLFYEAKWPRSARLALDRFLARQTNHVEALVTRARVLGQLEERLAAARDFSRAIALSVESRPELYVERAQMLTAEGPIHFDAALRGLDEGLKKLGPLVTLQLYAMDLEVKQKRFDAALARLDQAAAPSPRKETWLARRGEILRDAGRPLEARAAFAAAIEAIQKLPPARRNVPAMIELEKRLHAALETVKPSAPSKAPADKP